MVYIDEATIDSIYFVAQFHKEYKSAYGSQVESKCLSYSMKFAIKVATSSP